MMRILVVDDNADIRFLLATVLAADGHRVEEAAGGREALALLGSDPPPGLVILDVQMPEMDGWETLASIRARPATRDVAVILCTVRGSAGDRVRGWDLRCDGYLPKPFDVDALRAMVRTVAGRGDDERSAARLEGLAAARADLGGTNGEESG